MVLHICTSIVGCSYIDQLCRSDMTLYCTSTVMRTCFNCKVFLVCHFQVVMAQFFFFLIQRFNMFFVFVLFFGKPHCISEQSTQKLKQPVIFHFNVVSLFQSLTACLPALQHFNPSVCWRRKYVNWMTSTVYLRILKWPDEGSVI